MRHGVAVIRRLGRFGSCRDNREANTGDPERQESFRRQISVHDASQESGFNVAPGAISKSHSAPDKAYLSLLACLDKRGQRDFRTARWSLEGLTGSIIRRDR